MPTYDERFQDQVKRRQAQSDARQRFLDMIYARMEAEENARVQGERSTESANRLNWFDDASKGAAMGSAFGPFGALAGGIVGTAKGQIEAYRERGGGAKAFAQTIFDTPFGFNLAGGKSYGSLGGGTMENLIGAGGAAYGAHQRKQAMRSTAQGQNRTSLARMQAEGVAMPTGSRMDMRRPVNDENVGYTTRRPEDFYFG